MFYAKIVVCGFQGWRTIMAKPCDNCGGLKEVSISVPCPECTKYKLATWKDYQNAGRMKEALERLKDMFSFGPETTSERAVVNEALTYNPMLRKLILKIIKSGLE
jgi:reverse gyrase